jgi:hypothetical protein
MGIEPTWDFVEPHAGFEDQERHQAALHLRRLKLPSSAPRITASIYADQASRFKSNPYYLKV